MSYAHRHFRMEVDWIVGVLGGLFTLFQAGVLGLIMYSQRTFSVPAQRDSLSISAELLVIAAVEIGVLVVLWRLYTRLSGRWQQVIKYGIVGSLCGVVGAVIIIGYWGYPFIFLRNAVIALVVATVVYFSVKTLSSNGLKWIPFNIIALVLGIGVVSIASQQIAPVVVIPILVAFLVYDYIAVDLSNIMGSLIQFSGAVRLPNIIIIPESLRFDLSALFAYMRGERDEKPDGVAFVIGLGDFVFPSLLVGSAFVHQSLRFTAPVIGGILGLFISIPVLRAALLRRDKPTPALPWLASGAIGGYACGVVVVVLLTP